MFLKHSYILIKFILFSGEGHDENLLVVPTSLKLSQSLLVTVLTLSTLPQFIPELQFSKIWIFMNNVMRHYSTYTPPPHPMHWCDWRNCVQHHLTCIFTCFDIFFSSFFIYYYYSLLRIVFILSFLFNIDYKCCKLVFVRIV